MKRKFLPLILLAVFVMLVAQGCIGGTFNQKSYRAMGLMATGYEVGMKTATDLRARGLISDEGRVEIIEVGRSYANAHNKSVDAFVAYLAAETPDEAENLKLQYIATSKVTLSFYSSVMDLLSKFGFIGEPVEPWF